MICTVSAPRERTRDQRARRVVQSNPIGSESGLGTAAVSQGKAGTSLVPLLDVGNRLTMPDEE